MTQEEKELLLKDLSTRLPYQPICEFTDIEDDFCTTTAALGHSLRDFIAGKVLIKPYLRPMSSMTKAEKDELQSMHDIISDENYGDGYSPTAWEFITEWADYCNKHHLDYRGLIPMGLALPAKEEMYNI